MELIVQCSNIDAFNTTTNLPISPAFLNDLPVTNQTSYMGFSSGQNLKHTNFYGGSLPDLCTSYMRQKIIIKHSSQPEFVQVFDGLGRDILLHRLTPDPSTLL